MTRLGTTIQAAVVQDSPAFLNLREGVQKASLLIGRAAEAGAQLVAFPETWLPGYPVWLDLAPGAALWNHAPAKAAFRLFHENSLELGGLEIKSLGNTARKHKCIVVMGVSERKGGSLYNTMVYLGQNGDVVGVHRKLIPTYTERLIWARGDGSTLAAPETALGTIGGLICWEHWMPLACSAMHAKREFVHIAQWPEVKEMNLVSSRHYAFSGQCFVLAAGATLSRDELCASLTGPSETVSQARSLLNEIPAERDPLLLRGGSAIIAPDGSYLAGPVYGQAAILTATLDARIQIEGRQLLDVDGHYARPDVFRLEIDERPQVSVRAKSVGTAAGRHALDHKITSDI